MGFRSFALTVLISLILTAITTLFIPSRRFVSHALTLQSEAPNTDGLEVLYCDLNGNGLAERVEFYRLALGNSVNVKENGVIKNLYNLPKDASFLSKNPIFADTDGNGKKEIIFLMAKGKKAYLNFVEYSENYFLNFKSDTFFVDSVRFYNGIPDAPNFKIISDGSKTIFDLEAGFSVYPRALYLFDRADSTLKRSPYGAISSTNIDITTFQNRTYILQSQIFASDNTISRATAQRLSNSENPDSVALLREKSDKIFKYGDFSSYTAVYDTVMNFVFPPVEYPGWTNTTQSKFAVIDNELRILSATYMTNHSVIQSVINQISLDGKILRTLVLPFWTAKFFINERTNELCFLNSTNNRLEVYSSDFEYLKTVPKVDMIYGFYDLDADGKTELLASYSSDIFVLNSKLTESGRVTTGVCNSNIGRFIPPNLYADSGKHLTNLQFRNSSLIFEYSENPLSYLQYPAYLMVSLFWFGLISIVIRLNTKRLEAENRRLENLVRERTAELLVKNELLQTQKEEIVSQAEELKLTNEKLYALDIFKQKITRTIVHDLKNPLNAIILSSNSEIIKQPAYTMLNLVMNMLEVQKYREEKMLLDIETVRLSTLINEARKRTQFLFDSKHIQLNINTIEDFELRVDFEIIVRVFENLFSNSVRYSPNNSSVEVSAETADSNTIKLSVKDLGSGFPEDKIAEIFNEFSQFQNDRVGSDKTTGIGLAYCKIAVEAHCGLISAHNNTPQGAVISFGLPGKQAQTPMPRFSESNTEKEAFSERAKLILRPFSEKLSKIPFFEAGCILQIVNDIPEYDSSVSLMKAQIKSAVFSGNKKQYEELVSLQ